MATDTALEQEMALGTRVGGDVDLRSFDEGIVLTLGGKVINNQYYISIEGVDPPPGEPAIPVHFQSPEDLFANFRYPAFVIMRDDISVASERLHSMPLKYRAPARTAVPVSVSTPDGQQNYYNRVAEKAGAVPYSITYSINVYHTLRGGFGGKRAANTMLTYVLSTFPSFSQVFVRDSLGMWRTYEAFQEGVVSFDDSPAILERMIQYTVTVRVAAEYDLSIVTTSPTVTSHPVSRFTPKE